MGSTGDKAERILKRNGISNTQRRELAEAVPDQSVHLESAVNPAFGVRDLQGEEHAMQRNDVFDSITLEDAGKDARKSKGLTNSVTSILHQC